VKSLSLPGSFHEKISLLGSSLTGFTRLKSLDLSRNALGSTEGLENQGALESLNLYYNNISSLKDLHGLRNLSNLKVRMLVIIAAVLFLFDRTDLKSAQVYKE